MDYLDFDLEIEAEGGRNYRVAVRSPEGDTRQPMLFPFDKWELENYLLKLQNALLKSGGLHRAILTPEEQAVQNFGQILFEWLLSGNVRALYDACRTRAAQEGRFGVRLRLRILAPDLAALPWEYLYDQRRGEYLCLSGRTPLVRHLEVAQPILPLTITPPLRILAMIASPSDQPPLKVEREHGRLHHALSDLEAQGLVKLEWLPGQTWRDLQRAMRGGPWHIFHFIGHGGFHPQKQEGVLALANEEGTTHLLGATQLAILLAHHNALRLALLNACEGATSNQYDLFSSTAATLARRGVPAVLAMQYAISDRAAIECSRAFYEALADGLAVDAALGEARTAIHVGINNSLEWGTPVLYLRAPDGVLFKLSRASMSVPREVLAPQVSAKPALGTPLLKYEHSGASAWTIAWSPDWKRFASGGDDAAVRIWDVTTGKALLVLRGHFDSVTSVAWSPDGLQLASSSKDLTVRVWDAISGRQILSYEYGVNDPLRHISNLAWSPDGRLIAAGTDTDTSASFVERDYTVQVWEATSGRQIFSYKYSDKYPNGVRAIAWSPNGRFIACASSLGGDVGVYEATSGKALFHQKFYATSLAWSPDSRLLALGSDNRTVQVWDVISGKQLFSYTGHSNAVKTLMWSPNGRLIASGGGNTKGTRGNDYTVQLWEATSGRQILRYEGHSDRVHSVVWSPDGRLLASGGWDKTVQIWEAISGKLLQRYEVHHADEVYTVAWSPDGRFIASGSRDKTVQVRQATSGKLLFRYTGHPTDVKTLVWSPDGRLIASGGGYTGGNDCTVQIWEATSGRQILRYTGHPNSASPSYAASLQALAWSPDGRFIVSTSSSDKSVQVWETASGKLLLRYGSVSGKVQSSDGPYGSPPSGSVGAVAWSPDGRLIASAYADRDNKDYTVQVWEATSGRLLQRYEGHADEVNAVAWSSDSRLIASGGWDKTVQVWEATSGKQLLRYERHSDYVNAVVWSPNGRLIASGGNDNTVKVWEATSGNLLFTYWGHFTNVNSIAWSSNGEYIASAAHDVHIWQAP